MAWFFSALRFGALAPRQERAAVRAVNAVSRHPGRRRGYPLKIALALLVASSMWFYVEGVLIPYQQADAARFARPRGNLSDLYPRWLGSRELLLHHRDPYSREVTREIQVGYYGRELDPARPNDPKDQQGFAYPVYVAFLLAPFLHLDFAAVRTAFTWVLAALIVASVLLWAKALGWRLSGMGKVVFALLVVGSFPAAQGIKLQQLSVLVSFLVAAAAATLAAGWLVLAGLLLAFSTIKPQLVAPLLLFLLIWVVGDWSRRWPLLASFSVTTGCLAGASQWVLPGWLEKFLAALSAYRQYTGGVSILTTLLTPTGGMVVSAGLMVGFVLLAWKMRRAPADSSHFGLLLALALAVTMVVIPTWAPYNQLLLLPAIILLVRNWRGLIRLGRLSRLLYLLAAALVVWPWLATLYLSAAWFIEPAAVVQRGWTLPLYTSMLIPFAIMALLGLDGARRSPVLAEG